MQRQDLKVGLIIPSGAYKGAIVHDVKKGYVTLQWSKAPPTETFSARITHLGLETP